MGTALRACLHRTHQEQPVCYDVGFELFQLPDVPILEESFMRKSWLVCALMGTIAWGQAQPAAAPVQPSQASAASRPQAAGSQMANPGQAPSAENKPPAEVPENAVVLTVYGVCPATPAVAASKTGTSKAAPAAAKKSADCKTTLTREQFEKIAKGLSPSPTITPQLKRQLAGALPKFMAMSEAAKKQGLEQSEGYKETLKIAKMQILTTQLQRSVQEKADNVPETEIEKYYKENPEAYEQFSLDRLFIPRYKQESPEKANPDEKLTDEQQKAKEAADKAKQEQSEQELTKLADSLRERAAAGEDFTKLQKEAFEAANMKMDSPTVNLPAVRRTGLPPAHVAVFDLKVGEVSQVITDNGGHYIYKVVSKEVLPMDDKIKTEIHSKLKNDRMKEMMDKYTNSYHADTNEAYFGPPVPTGPGGRPMPPRMPRPNAPSAPQPQAQPQAAPPAQPTPPSKPN
jgi:hypothetical protein